MLTKQKFASVLLGALLISTLGVASAFAQTTPQATETRAQTAATNADCSCDCLGIGPRGGIGQASGAWEERPMDRPMERPGMVGSMRGGAGNWGATAVMAEKLGMTVEELQAARQSGKSLTQIAQERNMTREQLVEMIMTERQTRLNELVANGKLTQTQAQTMLNNMETRVGAMVDRTETGPMVGPRPGDNRSGDNSSNDSRGQFQPGKRMSGNRFQAPNGDGAPQPRAQRMGGMNRR